MKTFAITYSETIPALWNVSPETFETEARMAMCVKLYELGRLTSGQAAELAGIPRATFLLSCHQFGASSVAWDQAELDAESKSIHHE